ncbi:hypothetical protein ACA910_001678 [Epithemia clementina (nom. ined.)]
MSSATKEPTKTTAPEKPYPSGHDLKSIMINLATTILFLLPFAAYLYTEHIKLQVAVTVGALILAIIIPPIGWMRPHPYSDIPSNRLKTKLT